MSKCTKNRFQLGFTSIIVLAIRTAMIFQSPPRSMPDWESASGFQFRRKGPAPAKPVANKTKAPAAERRELSTSRPKNPIPKRRHTVSWAKATAGRASSSRRSSVALRGKRVSAAHNGLVGIIRVVSVFT